MRVKYFSTLAAASILSLGLIVGCSNPCAAGTKEGSTIENPVDPCAAKDANPCAAKPETVPCAGKPAGTNGAGQ